MDQRTPEWFAERAGKLTASRIADAIARTKTGWGASRKNLIATLVTERLTGKCADTFTNAAMQWGIDTEPKARAAYEMQTGELIEEVGFIAHPRIAMAGASPDGEAQPGGLEIKCPNTATHLDYLMADAVPKKYIPQIDWQMACGGYEWVDFVSFDPRLPEAMQLFIKRRERDDKAIALLEEQAEEFLADVEQTLHTLQERFKDAA